MILVQSNHFIHRFFGGISSSLRFLDLVWVSSFLYDEIEYVEHDVLESEYSKCGVVCLQLVSRVTNYLLEGQPCLDFGGVKRGPRDGWYNQPNSHKDWDSEYES